MHITARMELFSEAYVTAIAASAGYDYQPTNTDDDSIDCTISSKMQGRPRLELQLKATYQVADTRQTDNDFPFTLSQKNYNDLRIPIADLVAPRLLVVLLMPRIDADWLLHGDHLMTLKHAAYWFKLQDADPIDTTTKTVRIPWSNEFTSVKLDQFMRHIAVHKDLP
jgi:hypothetical protein